MTRQWGPTRAGDLEVGARMLGANSRIVEVIGRERRGYVVRLILDGSTLGTSMTMHEAAEVWAILPEETGT